MLRSGSAQSVGPVGTVGSVRSGSARSVCAEVR